jgi:hypothetical protein
MHTRTSIYAYTSTHPHQVGASKREIHRQLYRQRKATVTKVFGAEQSKILASLLLGYCGDVVEDLSLHAYVLETHKLSKSLSAVSEKLFATNSPFSQEPPPRAPLVSESDEDQRVLRWFTGGAPRQPSRAPSAISTQSSRESGRMPFMKGGSLRYAPCVSVCVKIVSFSTDLNMCVYECTFPGIPPTLPLT